MKLKKVDLKVNKNNLKNNQKLEFGNIIMEQSKNEFKVNQNLKYKLSRKKYIFYFSLGFAFMALIAMTLYLFVPLFYRTGVESGEVWSETQEFSLDYTVQLEKDSTKDFVVLNLADVQIIDFDLFNGKYDKTIALITKLIADKQPDLITLTGDNVAGGKNILVIQHFIKFIDSFDIPWAPVMGNHDNDGLGDYNWVADMMINTENCVMKKGLSDMGCGNYVITIMENDTIVQALIMMDSHDSEVLNNQQDWYSWVVNGLDEVAGYSVDSTVMLHIPLFEYSEAWDYWVASDYDENIGSGERNETVCCSDTSNGFFALIKALGSTKNIVCGHDHINDYSILYEGVRLTYAVKSGYTSYYNEDILGGTVLHISTTELNIEQYII